MVRSAAVIGEAPAVRIATRDDRAVTSEMLARAFAADPLLTWVFDRVGRGVPRAASGAGGSTWICSSIRHLLVESSIRRPRSGRSRGSGRPAREGTSGSPSPRPRAVRHPIRVLRGLGELELAHPKEPHLYLAVLGADPSAQGQGVGSALLRAGLQLADEERWPAYLETATERNVALYGRLASRSRAASTCRAVAAGMADVARTVLAGRARADLTRSSAVRPANVSGAWPRSLRRSSPIPGARGATRRIPISWRCAGATVLRSSGGS